MTHAAEALRQSPVFRDLGRYGLGSTRELSVEDVRERLTATVAAIRAMVPPPHAENLLTRLRGVWS